MRAIALLSIWQLRNAVRTSFTDVRKLIPMLFFVGMVALQLVNVFVFASLRTRRVPPEVARFLHENLPLIESAVFLVLLFFLAGIVDFALSRSFLAFPLPDVDYLFPSPVPRRVVLAYRLAAKTAVSFLQAAAFFYVILWGLVIRQLAPEAATFGAATGMFGSLFFCLAGYTNLALAAKLWLGFGLLAPLRRWLGPILIAACAALGWVFWARGPQGVGEIAASPALHALFYPCSVAASAITAPLRGESAAGALLGLLAFYAGSLALVFLRDENFYEASLEISEMHARRLQAARAQNWTALFALEAERRARGRRPRGAGRLYTLPPFGTGGAAYFWAHMASAAKRPWATFAAPVLGGVLIAAVPAMLIPAAAPFAVLGIGSYLLFLVTMGSIPSYRQALQRHALVKPLPLRPWEVVAADVAPRLLFTVVAAWSAAFTLLAMGVPRAGAVAPILLLCIPPLAGSLNLIQYLLALWYPDAQDKLHQLLAGFVSVFLTGIAMGVLVPLVAVPLVFGAPAWIVGLAFLVPGIGATAALLAGAGYLYGRFEPR